MKRLLFFIISILAGCGGTASSSHEKERDPIFHLKNEFKAVWKNATQYTLEVVDSIPEKNLDDPLAEGSMSFKGHALHIRENLRSLTTRYILESSHEREPELEIEDKTELKNALKRSFQKVKKALKKTSRRELRDTVHLFERVRVPKIRIFWLMRDHMTHHRGQMIIGLRKTGVTPPDYRGW